MEYNIRYAELTDCKKLSIVKRQVWETTYRGIYPDEKLDNYDYKKHEEKFISIINNKNVELYIAEVENEIIGYMECGTPIRPFSDYNQEIGLLYLLKEYQGYGIGKKLFLLGYSRIKEKGVNEFFISCNKYNLNGQKFYEKMGGKIIHIDEDNVDKSIPQVKFHYDVV